MDFQFDLKKLHFDSFHVMVCNRASCLVSVFPLLHNINYHNAGENQQFLAFKPQDVTQLARWP